MHDFRGDRLSPHFRRAESQQKPRMVGSPIGKSQFPPYSFKYFLRYSSTTPA